MKVEVLQIVKGIGYVAHMYPYYHVTDIVYGSDEIGDYFELLLENGDSATFHTDGDKSVWAYAIVEEGRHHYEYN